jgi:hypothetical protein
MEGVFATVDEGTSAVVSLPDGDRQGDDTRVSSTIFSSLTMKP